MRRGGSMKAVVWEEVGAVRVAEVPPPQLQDPGDALVRVRTASVCGSDLHLLHGRIPGMRSGGVIGHEFVGVVEEVGPAVSRVKPGDRVVGSFLIVCGQCWFCRRRLYNACTELRVLGYGMLLGDLDGAQAELVRVPLADTNLLPLPDDLTDEQAVFAGDILSTALYAASEAGIKPGDTVAVVGCGPVGLFCQSFASILGAARVVAVDMVPDRLELAARRGAVPVNAAERNAAVAVEELTEGRMADVVIEAVGGSPALASALKLVRRRGTVYVIGVHSDFEFNLPLAEVFVGGVDLKFGGTCPVQAYWEQALEMVRGGKVDPTSIITHRMPLEEAEEAYRLFDARKALKVVLTL